jgi:hypothetical protein
VRPLSRGGDPVHPFLLARHTFLKDALRGPALLVLVKEPSNRKRNTSCLESQEQINARERSCTCSHLQC